MRHHYRIGQPDIPIEGGLYHSVKLVQGERGTLWHEEKLGIGERWASRYMHTGGRGSVCAVTKV